MNLDGRGAPPTPEQLRAIAAARDAASAAIVASDSTKRLIVAGPGTGKTFTFKRALERCDGRGLALTFIRNLVADLESSLADLAEVFTFHAFCKYQLHRHPVEGLSEEWSYYPPLFTLLARDLQLLGHPQVTDFRVIDRAFHTLDDTGGLITQALRLGNYYNAVSHTDVVFRVLRHFEAQREDIPTYPLVVVDEYQDFSEMETSFIGLLGSTSPVLVAGDDDQALYGFKNASARYIRELAAAGTYSRFELPYCSRCTRVIVEAVGKVLIRATANGNLAGRLAKAFKCYLPEKLTDSQAHPKIIHAKCTVERVNAPYIGNYVVEQIREISVDDIQESRNGGYPTVLIIGPMQFVRRAFDSVHAVFPQAVLKQSEQPHITMLDAYRFLAQDGRSNLGWRTLIHVVPGQELEAHLSEALNGGHQLVDTLPEDLKVRQLQIADLIRRLLDEEDLTEAESRRLTEATGLTLERIIEELRVADTEDEEPPPDDADQVAPTIVCTSLIGAKGLSASHVFIVGFNNGHFPLRPAAITDDEVCSFLVGLSRTRKQCQLVSCDRFGSERLETSAFAGWVAQETDARVVNAAWFRGRR